MYISNSKFKKDVFHAYKILRIEINAFNEKYQENKKETENIP